MKNIMEPLNARRTVDLIANESPEAIELVNHITQNNFVVNHIYSGSSTPILKDKDLFVVGSGNIRSSYCRFIEAYNKVK